MFDSWLMLANFFSCEKPLLSILKNKLELAWFGFWFKILYVNWKFWINKTRTKLKTKYLNVVLNFFLHIYTWKVMMENPMTNLNWINITFGSFLIEINPCSFKVHPLSILFKITNRYPNYMSQIVPTLLKGIS